MFLKNGNGYGCDFWPTLKENGLLIFSTCSYSREEDEEIMDWLQQELDAENCPLKINEQWGIQETASPGGNLGYRFWPDKVKGEGFFPALFPELKWRGPRTY